MPELLHEARRSGNRAPGQQESSTRQGTGNGAWRHCAALLDWFAVERDTCYARIEAREPCAEILAPLPDEESRLAQAMSRRSFDDSPAGAAHAEKLAALRSRWFGELRTDPEFYLGGVVLRDWVAHRGGGETMLASLAAQGVRDGEFTCDERTGRICAVSRPPSAARRARPGVADRRAGRHPASHAQQPLPDFEDADERRAFADAILPPVPAALRGHQREPFQRSGRGGKHQEFCGRPLRGNVHAAHHRPARVEPASAGRPPGHVDPRRV